MIADFTLGLLQALGSYCPTAGLLSGFH